MTNIPTPEPDEPGASGLHPDEPPTEPGSGGNSADLSSLLATHLHGGQSGDLGLMNLLASRGAASGGLGSPDVLQNLALRMLEQHLTGSQPATDEPEPSPEEIALREIEEVERRRERLERQRQKMANLKHVLTSLYAEVETLRARNDAIAAALGACYLCFGDDPDCPECHGNGVPGSLQPDAATFRQYVLPAIRRIRAAHSFRPNGTSAQMRKEHDGHPDQNEGQPPIDPSA